MSKRLGFSITPMLLLPTICTREASSTWSTRPHDRYPMFASVALYHMPGSEPMRPKAVQQSWGAEDHGSKKFREIASSGLSAPVCRGHAVRCTGIHDESRWTDSLDRFRGA